MSIHELVERSLSQFIIQPATCEQYLARKGRIEIKTINVHFPLCPYRLNEPDLAQTYRNKSLVIIGNEVLFGELAVLRRLQKACFDGVWVDTFHGRGCRKVFWVGMPPNGPSGRLDQKAEDVYDAIIEKNLTKKGHKTAGGFVDVFAWKDGEYVFLEYKGKGDSIRPTQKRWIDAVTSSGIAKPEQLFLVQNKIPPV